MLTLERGAFFYVANPGSFSIIIYLLINLPLIHSGSPAFFSFCKRLSGANPTIVTYNARIVKFFNHSEIVSCGNGICKILGLLYLHMYG
jgi:hypothetical protein